MDNTGGLYGVSIMVMLPSGKHTKSELENHNLLER
jgi:hypothetical protein